MPDSMIKDLTEIIESHDQPDKARLRQHNVKLGLRDEDGAGIVVGATTKGQVIGYKKKYQSSIGPAEGQHEVDAEAVYCQIHGQMPNPDQLRAFIPKLQSMLPYEIEPCEGILRYCGIDINELVEAHKEDFGFEETAYLLLSGTLPNSSQLDRFKSYLGDHEALPIGYRDALVHQFAGPHMMNTLQTAVSNLYPLDQNPDSCDVSDVTRHSLDILVKFPSLVAYAYQAMQYKDKGKGLNIVMPSPEKALADDFLEMLFGGDGYTKKQALIIDKFLIMHAEHGGGNNSTFTVRVVSSAETDTYSTINAGLASLKGHLHGGANEKVMAMMRTAREEIKDVYDKDEVYDYLKRLVNKEAGDKSGKIYGLGHAVYTLSDPRAIIFSETARELAKETAGEGCRMDEFVLLDSFAELGPKAFAEAKGSSKVISPNVDFYSGFVLTCCGIPEEVYTPLFAMGRIAGWASHRLEQLIQNRLVRPAFYNLAEPRPYVPLEERA